MCTTEMRLVKFLKEEVAMNSVAEKLLKLWMFSNQYFTAKCVSFCSFFDLPRFLVTSNFISALSESPCFLLVLRIEKTLGYHK